MQFAIYNCLDACWTGSGVQSRSLSCLVIVHDWPIDFSLVEGVSKLFDKYCRGFVSRGIILQPLGEIMVVVFGKQSTTIAEGIDRALLIYCQLM